MSSSGGRAAAAGEGNTGAPGDIDRVCATCHSSGAFGPEISISLMDGEGTLIDAYEAGVTYFAEVSIATQTAPAAYGFQMVALTDQDNVSTNSFENPSINAKLSVANDRQYAEHNQPSPDSTFMVEWTAPVEGSGSVTFYVAGNAVNLAQGNGGDGADNTSFTIQESIMSSSQDFAFENLSVYPNPSDGIINITGLKDDVKAITVFDLYGKRIIDSPSSSDNITLDLFYYEKGIYILQFLTTENEVFSKKILVQ
jgi:hypothetical protein